MGSVRRMAGFVPDDFLGRFTAAAAAAGFAREDFGVVAGHALAAFTRAGPAGAPVVYLSAGMHGDEPAPPEALRRLVVAGAFDDRAGWVLCPMLNPTGLARGTRENADGVDLNRDYKEPATVEVRAHVAWLRGQPRYDAAFCLHEDYEAAGFYLYELNPDGRPSLAAAALAAAGRHGPIEAAPVIDGREAAAPGIIRPVSDPLLRDRWPEAIYLREHHTTLGYTFESPTAFDLGRRVDMHGAAVRAALALLLAGRPR
jgi:hypothetical protein